MDGDWRRRKKNVMEFFEVKNGSEREASMTQLHLLLLLLYYCIDMWNFISSSLRQRRSREGRGRSEKWGTNNGEAEFELFWHSGFSKFKIMEGLVSLSTLGVGEFFT